MPDALPSTLPPPMRVDLTGWTDDAIAAPAPRPAPSFLKPLSPERACRMPQWPDKAGREHADYGRFCNAPAVAGTSWCLACLRRVAAPSLRSVVPQLAAMA